MASNKTRRIIGGDLMVKKSFVILGILLIVGSMFAVGPGELLGIPALSSLYYARNPLDMVFRPTMLDVEGFYIPLGETESFQGLCGTLRLTFGPLALGASVIYSGYNLMDNIENGSLSITAGAGFEISGLVGAVYMPVPFDVESGSVNMSGQNLLLAFGIGNIKKGWTFTGRQYVNFKKGGGAIYYINSGIMGFDEKGDFVVNQTIDWLNGEVGIFSNAKTKDSLAVLDIRFNLNFLKNETEEANILNYVFATLQFESGAWILGATYDYGNRYLFDVGISLKVIKGWAELSFDTEFNMLGWGAFVQVSM